MSPGERIPVLVLSGFLGSGKTSLLRHTLPGSADTAVIVNEFGAVGLDHELLRACEERVELVGGGCACCSRRADLVGALRELLDARDRGGQALSRVVIETSGLADPAPIVFTITSDPMLRHHFEVERLVVTVDAVNCTRQLAAYPEARKQALTADELVITKVDLAGEEASLAVAGALHALNPAATIRRAAHGVPDDRPLDLSAVASAPVSPPAEWPEDPHRHGHGAQRRPGRPQSPDQDLVGPDQEGHLDGVSSLSLRADGPLDWLGFAVWLSMLLHARGQDVLRVKGILELDEGTLVSVNGVQHVVHMPEHLDRAAVGDPGSNIVFITRGIDSGQLRASFETFQRLARASDRLQAG